MKKSIGIATMMVVVLLFIAQTGQAIQPNELQNTILSYLGQPDFAGKEFWQKLSNTKTEIEMIDFSEGNIYLSIDTNDYSKKILDLICINPKQIEFGKTEQADRYFFRLPIDNLKIDLSKKVRYQFGKITYDISIPELYAFISNRSVYGGYLNVLRSIENNTIAIFFNHGAFVAKKGEVSLEKLASRITAGATSKEAKAQKLLDFVTAEIEYDYAEALSSAETLKRPNETLMTKRSDCSGKVILYASLLEQADIDYRLLYIGDSSVDHISVAVEGSYPNSNNLEFELGTKKYSVAETTIEEFKIGRSIPATVFGHKIRLSYIKYIQKPGKDSKILDVKTGEPLEFY